MMRRREFITLLGGRGGMAADGARAAASDAGNRVFGQRGVAGGAPVARFSAGPEGHRLR